MKKDNLVLGAQSRQKRDRVSTVYFCTVPLALIAEAFPRVGDGSSSFRHPAIVTSAYAGSRIKPRVPPTRIS